MTVLKSGKLFFENSVLPDAHFYEHLQHRP